MNEQLRSSELKDSVARINSEVLPYGLARAARLLMLEVKIAEANIEGRRSLEASPIELKPGLHVGCGANILENFTNLDIFPNEGVDVVCDAREGLPFADNQFETVFSEHMMEHVDYPNSVKTILGEMARVTQPGGRVVVGVPDSGAPMKAYAAGDTEYLDRLKEAWYGRRAQLEHYSHPIDVVRLVVGDEDDAPGYAPHFWAYDHDKLQSLMEEAGLVDITPWDFEDISLEKRRWNAVYLQGIKPQE